MYIHTNDATNQTLNTSGVISGGGVISAVYTMPMEDTGLMYSELSSMLLSKSIRDGEGFYNIAKILSSMFLNVLTNLAFGKIFKIISI